MEGEGSKNAARQVLRYFVGGTAAGEGRGLACREASGNARSPVERGSALLKRRSGAVKVARRDLGSGGALVLVDDAAEDVTAGDRAAVVECYRVGDWLGELQATVWSGLVVVADVLGEQRFEMSS